MSNILLKQQFTHVSQLATNIRYYNVNDKRSTATEAPLMLQSYIKELNISAFTVIVKYN